MLNFLLNLVPTGIQRAYVLKAVRWAATAASGAAAMWVASILTAHGYSPADVSADAAAAGGIVFSLVSGIGALAFSLWDAKKVQAKTVVAAATGDLAAADDPAVMRAAAAAGAIRGALTPAQEEAVTRALNKSQLQ